MENNLDDGPLKAWVKIAIKRPTIKSSINYKNQNLLIISFYLQLPFHHPKMAQGSTVMSFYSNIEI